MAARSLGSVTISFGLIAIPVELFSATESSGRISFNLLHKDCGSRLKQQYICIKDQEVVERQDMVKGYEFEKDRYVQFTPEEIKALDEVGTHSIDIAEFVAIEAIDPVYFDNAYYLTPDKGGARPYALLSQALKETRRCAIGRWAARGHSNLVILRPIGDVIAMQQLRFANEVRPVADIALPPQEIKAAELALAKQLIEQQASDSFDPGAYVDEVHTRIEAAIEKKLKGEKISIDDTRLVRDSGNVIDIMAALSASLKGAKSAKASVTKMGARKAPKRIEQARKATGKASRR